MQILSACLKADGIAGRLPLAFRGDTFSHDWMHLLFRHQRFCLKHSHGTQREIVVPFPFYYSFMYIVLLCTYQLI